MAWNAVGYLIDAKAMEVREVTITGLADLQQAVGGYIEAAYEWPSGDVLYVDEEGLLKAQEHWFRIPERPDQSLAGNGLLVGREVDDTGRLAARPAMSLAGLKAKVTFQYARQR